jgi:putative IMPACT (imprinted ancient) family translation regulator
MCDRASQHRFVRAYYASTTDTHSEPRANDGIESVRLSFMAAQQIVLRAGVGIERNAITAVSARFELTSVLDIYPLLHNTGASHQKFSWALEEKHLPDTSPICATVAQSSAPIK